MFQTPNSLSESIEILKSGKVSLSEYVNQICDTIDKNEQIIQSLLPETHRRERLLKETKQLEEKFLKTEYKPELYGIPVGVKDIFKVDGFETKCGSSLPSELFNGKEASVVTKLKECGAIILGKTVTTEFAYFEPGNTRNPANTEHTPGGSSSGSAAAVSAGFTPLALGTQTIGSIIRPASFCGVIGYKPTYGRITKDGVIPFAESVDHVGFFTQDIKGAEITAGLLCKNWQPIQNKLSRKPVIGIASGKYLEQVDNEIASAFTGYVSTLKQKGFVFKEIDIFGDIEYINRIHKILCAFELADAHKNWFDEYKHLYRPKTIELIEEGRKIRTSEVYEIKQMRDFFRQQIEVFRLQNQIDCWISPATLTIAPESIASTGSPIMNLPWTFAGVPVITFPIEKNAKNLPIGVQIAGSTGGDEELFYHINKLIG